jgi:ubiquinone/menaquinone biosynthesis C-methylase UbiE
MREKIENIENKWLNKQTCQRLQTRWGDYDEFENKPNMENKIEIIQLLHNKLNELNKEGSVMEIGCGSGHFLWTIRKFCKEIIAFDYSPEMLNLTKKQFENFDIPIKYIQGSCWNLPFPDNYSDLVFQVDVCMHVGGSWDSIREMIRVSKKYVIFTGPSFDDYGMEMDHQIAKLTWGVNQKLVNKKLKKLQEKNIIKKFEFLPRKRTKVYNHKILLIEK